MTVFSEREDNPTARLGCGACYDEDEDGRKS